MLGIRTGLWYKLLRVIRSLKFPLKQCLSQKWICSPSLKRFTSLELAELGELREETNTKMLQLSRVKEGLSSLLPVPQGRAARGTQLSTLPTFAFLLLLSFKPHPNFSLPLDDHHSSFQ